MLIRPQLLEILECPWCAWPTLNVVYRPEKPFLCCQGCGRLYSLQNNIPLLYREDALWEPKRREADGWVAMWKESGLYDTTTFIPDLPFISIEPWATVARMFQAALFQMDLKGTERILDLGAGEGWASQHFAQHGCHAVAIDIVADDRLGLGRAWRRMEYSNTRFDLVIGDNERLPFQPNTFDFVFASNALHHSNNLGQLLKSAYRVLRPGGRIIAIGDPVRSIFQPLHEITDGATEKAHNIIEQRHLFAYYLINLWKAGFRGLHWDEERTWVKPAAELYPWLHQQSLEIVKNRRFSSRSLTRLLGYFMLRLPRPFAMAMFMSLQWSTTLFSGTKPRS